jgi:hypothetical protein
VIHAGRVTGRVAGVQQMAVSKETYDDCIPFYITTLYIITFYIAF